MKTQSKSAALLTRPMMMKSQTTEGSGSRLEPNTLSEKIAHTGDGERKFLATGPDWRKFRVYYRKSARSACWKSSCDAFFSTHFVFGFKYRNRREEKQNRRKILRSFELRSEKSFFLRNNSKLQSQ
jgi:hypothetical protein